MNEWLDGITGFTGQETEETPGDSLIFSYTPQVLLWGVCAVYFSHFCVWESSMGLVNIQAAWFQHQ